MEFTYLQEQQKRYSFERPKFRSWVESQCDGKVLNLFAGRTKLGIEEVRVDNNEKSVADHYIDAMDFIKNCNETFNTIILDPPQNMKTLRVKYRQGYEIEFEIFKNEIINILADGGKIINIGKDSIGMGRQRGFEKTALCLVHHNAGYEDLIALVEENKIKKLSSFF